MGKRSDFVRRERDWYPTPAEAVLPLIPHLERGASFIEPCAGDGALIRHLQAHGLSCAQASDIAGRPDEGISEADALTLMESTADYIITNPPWARDVLHPMIRRFSAIRPTWLLFDADWMHTRQAVPFLPLLRTVVSVGRVKWIPGSKMTGKDNCAWHMFWPEADGITQFIGRPA